MRGRSERRERHRERKLAFFCSRNSTQAGSHRNGCHSDRGMLARRTRQRRNSSVQPARIVTTRKATFNCRAKPSAKKAAGEDRRQRGRGETPHIPRVTRQRGQCLRGEANRSFCWRSKRPAGTLPFLPQTGWRLGMSGNQLPTLPATYESFTSVSAASGTEMRPGTSRAQITHQTEIPERVAEILGEQKRSESIRDRQTRALYSPALASRKAAGRFSTPCQASCASTRFLAASSSMKSVSSKPRPRRMRATASR